MSAPDLPVQSRPWLTSLRRSIRFAGGAAVVLCVTALALSLLGESDAAVEISAPIEPPSAGLDRLYDESIRRIAAVHPRGVWLAIDTTGGKMRVYRGDTLLHESPCSAGSGLSLRDPRTGRVWTFQTPIGERRIQRKVKDPVWTKPDWAFVEEGYAPPPLGARDRRDDFSLGAYALHLGDGYMIHGTVFQTLVGRAITHGCIRLRDKDLEYVYKTVPAGARVLLY